MRAARSSRGGIHTFHHAPHEASNRCRDTPLMPPGDAYNVSPSVEIRQHALMNPTPISTNDRLLNDFATRCFRDVADGDYIAARQAYRATLFSQFLWASQQAIEKYLKCILLQNRIPAPDVKHDLEKALFKLDAQTAFPIKLSEQTRQFIGYINQYGPWRYLEVSYYLREYEILKLDRAVWEIRRHAEPHNFWTKLPNGELVHHLPAGIEKIRRSEEMPPAHFPGVGGLLESIIANRKHSARGPLLWQNGFFGVRARKTVRMRGHMNAVNAPLSLHPEILDEVQRYVFIPRDIAQAYSELAAEQLADRATAVAAHPR